MKEKKSNIFKLITLIILFFGSGTVFLYLLKLLNVNYSLFDYGDIGLLNTAIEAVLALFVYIFYQKYLHEDAKNLLKAKPFINNLFKYFCLFWLVKIASSLAETFLGLIFGLEIGESANQSVINSITNFIPITMLLTSSLLAPLAEEGIFRLGFRKVIKNKYAFIVISGLLFGLMHIFPTDIGLTKALIESVSYVSVGITLSYIYAQTDNIWYSIIIHAINNLIGLLAIIAIA